jgi:hypothetical protein
VKLNIPTEEENQQAISDFFARQRKFRAERDTAVAAAKPALARLAEVCRNKTGQSYKIRALLFSLWNGKPAKLSDTLGLDWDLKKDFAAVLLAFCAEDFYYYDLLEAFKAAGLSEWFLEEGEAKS